MQTTPIESRLMVLPPELRCHIYSFLPELVYKYIWPVVKLPPVGVCSWPYFRLPTSLLLVNKLVYEETKDSSVQTQLQNLNEQYLPVLVMGPFTALHSPRNEFLRVFCGLLSRHNGNDLSNHDPKEIGRQITAWSNLSLSDRLGVHWEQIYERLPSDSGYSEKNLDLFIICTLARMAHNRVKEVQVRLLLCSSSLTKRSTWDRRILGHLIEYRVRALIVGDCDYESVSAKEGVTFVLRSKEYELPLYESASFLQQSNVGFQIEEPSIQDQQLLFQLGIVSNPP